jgi:trimethylamine--corrinoid protein Co-methyltransferase
LDDAEARALLHDHGARESQDRICLPPELVESCIARCPDRVVLKGRSSEIVLGTGELHVHNLGGARDVIDRPGVAPRPAVTADVAESTRLLDALENVTTITPLYTPRDVPPYAMVATMFAETLKNTTKPVNGPGAQTADEVRALAEMARVAFGDASAMSLGISPVSPLTFPADTAQAMLEAARQGIPLGPLPCPQVGTTAPMTLAGSLAQQNAEVLASIVLAQLVRPGLPVVYCGRLAPSDMRTALPIWGNPEIALISAATVQIGHSYHLPVNVYGLCGSGVAVDIQSGVERGINALAPALAGADELSGVGELVSGTAASNAQMVIDDEIFAMVRRVRRGFAVNEDTLAVEVIAQAMNSAMHTFLAQRHTVTHLKAGEVWQPKLSVHGVGWEQWKKEGLPTIEARAQAEAERVLTEHEVPPLPEDQVHALEEIVRAAARQAL